MLLKEFLEPMEMTQTELADRIGVSFVRVNSIVKGHRGITPDTALRLAKLFGTTPDLWLNGQIACDLWHAMRSPEASAIDKIETVQSFIATGRPAPAREDSARYHAKARTSRRRRRSA
jgi:addiction module HigA family antidote